MMEESSMLSPLATPNDINQTWLEGVLRCKLLTDVKIDSWKCNFHEDSEGCISEMCFVDVAYTGLDGCKGERSLVIKCMPKSAIEREIMKQGNLDKREVEFYKYADSENFRVFCQRAGLFNLVPDVYSVHSKNDIMTISLQNLYKDGYEIMAPVDGNSLEQIKCILRSIAVIHASGITNARKSVIYDLGSPFDQYFAEHIKVGIAKQIKLFHGNQPIVETLKAVSCVSDDLIGISQRYPFIDAIVHGDFRSNNIMFSNDNKSVCIFDWQFSHIGNPVCDIATLLIVSSHPSVYSHHLVEALQCYWESFEKALKENGVPLDLTFQDLLQNLEILWMHGFMFYSSCLSVVQADGRLPFIGEDRMQSVVIFLDKIGAFDKFLKSCQKSHQ